MPASSSARRPMVQYMNRLKRISHPPSSRAERSEVEGPLFAGIHEGSLDCARDWQLRCQLVQLDHVVAQDALLELGRQLGGLFGDHVLAPRPGRIAVREIVGPHQL